LITKHRVKNFTKNFTGNFTENFTYQITHNFTKSFTNISPYHPLTSASALYGASHAYLDHTTL
jgi:hypothetical protein